MTREADFATRMGADATLTAILTGGIYQAGNLGFEGISRTNTPAAFDANGFLLPCALVKERGEIPDRIAQDQIAQRASTAQVVEIWLYQDRQYASIDAALSRLFVLFYGHQFSDSLPLDWINTINREQDEGALQGSSLARQDWIVYSIKGG